MSQMEENAHCPPPEKLSSLAFCLSMNSLCVHRGPGQSSRVQRDSAMLSRAKPCPAPVSLGWGMGMERGPGNWEAAEEDQRGHRNFKFTLKLVI